MKSTENLKKTIEEHLQQLGSKDELFAETLKKENKNIDDCITYILNQVQSSGCNGFTDDEIFGMAVHYYDEDNLKPGKKINSTVVVNHKVELSVDDIETAKQKALDSVVAEEKQKIRQKPLKAKKAKVEEKASDNPSLFDEL